MRIPHLEAALRQRARGFPIPVYYNGQALPRPHALDSGRRFEGTAVGDVYLHGAMSGKDRWGASHALACYLQGLPVHATAWEDGERTTLVHLDSRRFLARLPDRDTLIDAPEAIDQVEKEVARLAQERLRRLKAELPAEEFVRGFACLERWKALSLVNDVPYVPAEVLSRIEDYPMIPRWEGDGPAPYSEPLPRAALDAGQVRLARLDGLYEEAPGAAVRWIFAWRMGYTVIDPGALDADHWVHRYVQDLEVTSFDIEIVGPGKVLN